LASNVPFLPNPTPISKQMTIAQGLPTFR
jgi:hypothetical protein